MLLERNHQMQSSIFVMDNALIIYDMTGGVYSLEITLTTNQPISTRSNAFRSIVRCCFKPTNSKKKNKCCKKTLNTPIRTNLYL